MFEASELDTDILAEAEHFIAGALASPELSPATIARSLGVSRAGLYRAFAPSGGVMQHVWAARLEAVRIAVGRPIQPRTLKRLAADHGFKSAAHLSSRFRARFGVAPREWRARAADPAAAMP